MVVKDDQATPRLSYAKSWVDGLVEMVEAEQQLFTSRLGPLSALESQWKVLTTTV